MGSQDSINYLAGALESFFKGLSECGILHSYSVQLNIGSVDFVGQMKFHCLMCQFMKTLQALLLKTSIPDHESTHDVGVQTPSDFDSVLIEVKQNDTNEHVSSDQLGSLVQTVLADTEDDIDWTGTGTCDDIKGDQNTFIVQRNGNETSTDIIVTCHPAALAAISGQVTSSENITPEADTKKLDLSSVSVENFRSESVDSQEIITVTSVPENNLRDCGSPNKNLNLGKDCYIEVDSSKHFGAEDEETNNDEIKSIETEINPMILKTYVDEQTIIGDTLSVMHIVVASDSSGDKPVSNLKNEKDKKKPFKCKNCDKSFSTTQSLEVHLNRKHSAKEQCDMCPRSFSSIQSLQEHCRLEHGGIGCFNCLLCSRRFMTKLSYKRHMDTHVGKKEAVCDMCGKTFSRADYLNKHYMTHSGARPLSCSQCPRKFISSSHLKNHEKTHTGEREHLCKLCPKSFSRADKLKEHTLRHLNIKKFQCTTCKRTYAEKRDLTKHMRAHEK